MPKGFEKGLGEMTSDSRIRLLKRCAEKLAYTKIWNTRSIFWNTRSKIWYKQLHFLERQVLFLVKARNGQAARRSIQF